MKPLAAGPDDPVPFPIQGTGTQTRSFIYVDDFIDALVLAMERGDHLGIYHVGTMEELTIADVSRAIGAYFDRRVRIIPTDPAAGGTSRRCPDTAKIARLGFQPKFSFRDGLALTAQWYVEHADRAPHERSLTA